MKVTGQCMKLMGWCEGEESVKVMWECEGDGMVCKGDGVLCESDGMV